LSVLVGAVQLATKLCAQKAEQEMLKIVLLLAIYNVHLKSEPSTSEVEFDILFSLFAHSTKISN
jgi:hypothetical protein